MIEEIVCVLILHNVGVTVDFWAIFLISKVANHFLVYQEL